MSAFVQAVAMGIAGAVLLGFAYWGILVLIQPVLDRLRVVVHGKPASGAVIAEVPTEYPLPFLEPPRIMPPREPSAPVTVGPQSIPNYHYIRSGSLKTNALHFSASGIVPGIVGLTLVGSPGHPPPKQPFRTRQIVLDNNVLARPEHSAQQQIVLKNWYPLRRMPRSFALSDGVSLLGSMVVEREQGASEAAKALREQELPELLGAPDDASMSKLRMAKFSQPFSGSC